MNNMERSLVAAIASVLSTLTYAADVGQPVHPEKPTYKYEKCYGVARAEHNDCFTARNSCGGTVQEDGRADAWIYVPDGTCRKVVGGSLEPKPAPRDS